MNAWYFLSIPACVILAITALARLADMGRNRWRWNDHLRRLGIAGVGITSVIVIFAPITWNNDAWPNPDWMTTATAWSFALVWLTTPAMPPWWDFILGIHREECRSQKGGLRSRAASEWRALRASFRTPSVHYEPMNKGRRKDDEPDIDPR